MAGPFEGRVVLVTGGADAVLYPASDRASFLDGKILRINGGLAMF